MFKTGINNFQPNKFQDFVSVCSEAKNVKKACYPWSFVLSRFRPFLLWSSWIGLDYKMLSSF